MPHPLTFLNLASVYAYGERIIMSCKDGSFAIVPIEDVLLLDAEGL